MGTGTTGGCLFTLCHFSVPGKHCVTLLRELKFSSVLKCGVITSDPPPFKLLKATPCPSRRGGNSQPKKSPNPRGFTVGGAGWERVVTFQHQPSPTRIPALGLGTSKLASVEQPSLEIHDPFVFTYD